MAGLLHASYEGTLRLATQIDTELRLRLAERGSIRMTPAVPFAGSVNGRNSDTTTIPLVGLDGYDSFTATAAEDTEVAVTDVSVATGSIAVGRASIVRSIGDLFRLTDGTLDAARLAASMVGEYDQYWMASLATQIATFTTNVGGGAGVDMTVDDAFDALYTLELASVPAPWWALLHPQQSVDFKNDLRSETGVLQFTPATAELIAASGGTLIGEWMGATWYKSAKITASGGAREGGLWGAGAVMWKNGIVENLPTDTVVVRPDADIFVEFERQGTKAVSKVIGHAYSGFGIIEQSRGVGIVTDD
jgi:hypothetical protein